MKLKAPAFRKIIKMVKSNKKDFMIYTAIFLGISAILLIIIFKYPVLAKTIFQEGGIGDKIYFICYIAALILIITKKGGLESKPQWNSMVASSFLPGLGQVMYAKQWAKMIVLWIILFGGAFFSSTISIISPIAGALIILALVIIDIWNIIDAYKIGKKVKYKK